MSLLSLTVTKTLEEEEDGRDSKVLDPADIEVEEGEGERRERLLEGTRASVVNAPGVITLTGGDCKTGLGVSTVGLGVAGELLNTRGGGGGREDRFESTLELSDESLSSLSLELDELVLSTGLLSFIFFRPAGCI